MASKNTSIDITLTPSGSLPFAEAALGKIETPVQDRFTSGSLAANIMSVSENPLLILVAASFVLAADQTVENNDLEDDSTGALESLSAVAEETLILHFDSPSGKSGSFNNIADTYGFLAEVEIDIEEYLDTLIGDALLKPVRPVFTILSAINKIEKEAELAGKGFAVLINQKAENLTVFIFDSPLAAYTATNDKKTAFTTNEGVILAVFNTPVPVTNSTVPKFFGE